MFHEVLKENTEDSKKHDMKRTLDSLRTAAAITKQVHKSFQTNVPLKVAVQLMIISILIQYNNALDSGTK